MGHRTLKGAVCKAPCFLDDPKLKILKLLPHSKECGFQFMDIILFLIHPNRTIFKKELDNSSKNYQT